ncbi:MAG: hypothetical protein WBA12_03665, partial [Catalinimonas sp.]
WYADPNNTVEFGASTIYYNFKPGEITTPETSSFIDQKLDDQYALEPAVYLSNEQKLGALTLQYGLRASAFYRFGAGTEYLYDENRPQSEETIVDSIVHGRGDVMASFGGLEPRFAANYRLGERSSVKASYQRTRQYIHLISNTTAATPLDVWAPSGPAVNPALADQVAVGYFRNFRDNTYEFSAETYYKHFQDVVDYKDGANLLLNEYLTADLLRGDGRAYGLELMMRRQIGRLTGWVGYTLARTERQVLAEDNGLRPEFTRAQRQEIEINNGEYYAANWDKTHDLTVVAAYELNDRWTVSTNFSYMTGRPITYPNARYEWNGIQVPNYDNRNGARTPDYHRLDFSATWERPRPDRRWQGSWTFSVYNAYNRRNPYSIYFRQNADDATLTEAVQFSVFGSVIPAVTYNFTF